MEQQTRESHLSTYWICSDTALYVQTWTPPTCSLCSLNCNQNSSSRRKTRWNGNELMESKINLLGHAYTLICGSEESLRKGAISSPILHPLHFHPNQWIVIRSQNVHTYIFSVLCMVKVVVVVKVGRKGTILLHATCRWKTLLAGGRVPKKWERP